MLLGYCRGAGPLGRLALLPHKSESLGAMRQSVLWLWHLLVYLVL